MSAGPIPAALADRAAAQTPPLGVPHFVTVLTSMANVLGRATTSTASDVVRRALGLSHVVAVPGLCGSAGSLAVNPSTNGGLRVGYDYPHDPRPATARRSPAWAAQVTGWDGPNG